MKLAVDQPQEAPLDTSKLVPLALAAERMGCCLGHLSRRCRDELNRRGLAVQVAGKWHVHIDTDPRLLDGPIGEAYRARPSMDGFTQRQQDQARQRAACVEALRQARLGCSGRFADALPDLIQRLRLRFPKLKIGRTQLYEWDRDYRRPADLAKLIDHRGGNRRGDDDPAAWQAFADLYLHQNRPTIEQCWEAVRKLALEREWKWCSLDSCYRQVDRRIAPEKQLKARDPDRWRQQLAPYIQQAPEAWGANERWAADHHQFNIWCVFNGTIIRPWLTAVQDWRTRKFVGWVLSDCPNSTTILGALHHALSDPDGFGPPAEFLTDNGKDFDAYVFHGQTKKERRERVRPAMDEAAATGILRLLGMEPHFAIPHNPNGKSRIERSFGTFEPFYRTFDTYCGNATDTKPERLNEILKRPELIPPFDEVLLRFDEFVAGKNASADHDIDDLTDGAKKLSPGEAMALWVKTRRVMVDPAALELLLVQWAKPVTAHRNGITLSIAGRAISYGAFEPLLSPFKALAKADRKPLRIAYNPRDLRTVRVHDEQWRYLCTVEMNGSGGGAGPIAEQHVKDLARRKSIYNRALNHVAEHSITRLLTTEEQLGQIAAAGAARKRVASTAADASAPSLAPVATPLDGQARLIASQQRRTQLRLAVAPPVEAPARDVGGIDLLAAADDIDFDGGRSSPPLTFDLLSALDRAEGEP